MLSISRNKNEGIGLWAKKAFILATPTLLITGAKQEARMTSKKDNNQKEIPILMTGIDVMNYLSLDAVTMFFLAHEGALLPYHSGPHPSWFKLYLNSNYNHEGELSKWKYLKSDVDAFKLHNKKFLKQERQKQQKKNAKNEKEKKSPSEAIKNAPIAENIFKRSGDFWTVHYEGKESIPIKHVDGLSYIAQLLRKPKMSISCQYLAQSIAGKTQDIAISESVVEKKDLSIGFRKQPIGSGKERKISKEKYDELEESLSHASIEKQEEIKEEMVKLAPYLNLKERNFADPNDKKAQINIKKRLDKAYEVLCKAKMKSLVEHLKEHIQTDDAYGLKYNGNIAWVITIK